MKNLNQATGLNISLSLNIHRGINRKGSGLVQACNGYAVMGSFNKVDVYHKYMNRISQPTTTELGSLAQDLEWFYNSL
jgi:hypothetical protein